MYSCLIITGQHLVNSEIFTFNQSGNNQCSVKFKDNMIFCTKDGKDLMIGFNPKFLIDALRVIEDEEVDLYFMNAKAPCFIKDENQSYIYLILPVNFNAAV